MFSITFRKFRVVGQNRLFLRGEISSSKVKARIKVSEESPFLNFTDLKIFCGSPGRKLCCWKYSYFLQLRFDYGCNLFISQVKVLLRTTDSRWTPVN
jgi:hypothetical protein